MIKYCNINGTIVKMDRASIPINDVGLLRGYGMFDYFIFEKQFPFFFDDYLDRFYNSVRDATNNAVSDCSTIAKAHIP